MSELSPDSLSARLLAALPPSRVLRLRLERGATVFRQGDPALAIYVVEAGRVRLSRMLADGASLVLHVANAGESFAEASLSATHYHCDAIAETDSVVLALPKADLLALMTTDPAPGVAFALALASQVRDLRTKLELRNVRSAKRECSRGCACMRKAVLHAYCWNRSWTLITEELGLTREAVYRALAMLDRERRIGRHDGVISLNHDVE